MDCGLQCSGCGNVQSCQTFFDLFILPDILKEEEERCAREENDSTEK